MGMNYYLRVNACASCARYDEVHIGKSSAGWTFTFRGYRFEHAQPDGVPDSIESYQDWLEVLREHGLDNVDEGIFDEDAQRMTLKTFIEKIEASRNEPHHHAREYPAANQWTDAEGHSFSDHEFS